MSLKRSFNLSEWAWIAGCSSLSGEDGEEEER